ncbi:hypothetical protein [Marivirga sp.]|uniref:hypothetical protein n=1 Tax=Marivirga sp. TaxID=2018662 RepID=UPI002D80B644|nr:hypothetical protein [Marivirga sp.]HET8858901.1 hypothetical protein [Marivirga sp.]
METHKIDQLFKQKLERHSEPVSADAFAKVQAQMKGKKQKKGFPWMIAASVSILVVLSFGLVYNLSISEEQNLAKIELNDAQLSFYENKTLEIPEVEEVETSTAQKPAVKSQVQKSDIQTSRMPFQTAQAIREEDFNRIASLEKLEIRKVNLNQELIPELRIAPTKHENKVIVEIHYAYADSKKEENLIEKSNNKLKSLASEFSLSDLRSAKNELFASALQFNRKGNN